MNDSILYKDVGHLAKLLSRCFSLLADQDPRSAWRVFHDVSQAMECLTSKVEKDWEGSLLAAITFENDLGGSYTVEFASHADVLIHQNQNQKTCQQRYGKS